LVHKNRVFLNGLVCFSYIDIVPAPNICIGGMQTGVVTTKKNARKRKLFTDVSFLYT
jgi:hypothetical protein